jgi:hypothetical protein
LVHCIITLVEGGSHEYFVAFRRRRKKEKEEGNEPRSSKPNEKNRRIG